TGDAPALRGVVVHEIDRAGVEQSANRVARDLALTRRDRNARRAPHARHQRDVVVPVTRLLEPADVERLDEMREADRVLYAPAAIGIDGEDEVGARGAAGRLDTPRVLLGREPADLELASGHAGAAIVLHLAADVGV